jgi:hypothetical protein
MRTLTNVELGFVSGGESPCYALKGNAGCSPSTPGMSAGQIANALFGVAAVAANFVKSMVATRVAAAAALAAYLLDQVED